MTPQIILGQLVITSVSARMDRPSPGRIHEAELRMATSGRPRRFRRHRAE